MRNPRRVLEARGMDFSRPRQKLPSVPLGGQGGGDRARNPALDFGAAASSPFLEPSGLNAAMAELLKRINEEKPLRLSPTERRRIADGLDKSRSWAVQLVTRPAPALRTLLASHTACLPCRSAHGRTSPAVDRPTDGVRSRQLVFLFGVPHRTGKHRPGALARRRG
jgi:hypothetical protein